jgi:hypothetical protein
MERPLRIFEMTETADPIALARSRTLQSPLLREYAATRARSTIEPKSARNDWCRMDLPGPTTSVGTRTDYSVGPWDYPACATRHLKAWSTRTAEE